MPSAPTDRSVAVRLAAAVALFLLLLGQAQVTVLDGSSMLAVARSIVHDGNLSVPPELGVLGHDGAYYSKYGLLLPLLSVLPLLVVQPVGAVTGHVGLLEGAVAASLMPVIAGALAAALFALGRRLGAPRPAALLVASGTVLGTYVLPYGRDFFTEPLVALGLVVMVERALAGRSAAAGAALTFAVLARPQSAAFVPLLFLYLYLRGGGLPAVLRTLPPLAIAAAVTVGYNLVRFADALEFGYREPGDHGFSTPLPEGAGGLLFSPEKSVVLFAPAIVLVPFAAVALWRHHRAIVALVLGLFAAVFVLAALWWSWEGGWSWGPRLILPGVAVLFGLVAPWIGNHAGRLRLAAALFAVGFVLSFSAVLAPAGAQLLDRDRGTDGPQIVRQYADLPRLTEHSIDAAEDRRARDGDYRRYLAVWQAGIVREFGTIGLVPALLGTLALLAALLTMTRPLVHLEVDGIGAREQHRQPGARVARRRAPLAQHDRRPRAAPVDVRRDLLGVRSRDPTELLAARDVHGDRVGVVFVSRVATQRQRTAGRGFLGRQGGVVMTCRAGHARDAQTGIGQRARVAREILTGEGINDLVAGEPDDGAIVRVPVPFIERHIDRYRLHRSSVRMRPNKISTENPMVTLDRYLSPTSLTIGN